MGSNEAGNVIHRKTRVAREGYQARAMSPAKALRLALARAAARQCDLVLAVTAVEQLQIPLSGLPGALGGDGLLVLLDGDCGLGGALRLDASFLGALIEAQTTGRVTGRRTEARAVTRTDAAIAAPLIDAALGRFADLLTEESGEHWGAGWKFGAMAEDARSLGLVLTEVEYHHFRLMVEIGDVAQPGVLSLLLPVRACPAHAQGRASDADSPGATLGQGALDAPVCVEAVLARFSLPLDRVCALRAGDVLPFGLDRPLSVRLEVGPRHKLAGARLGQVNGLRAVRLMMPADTPPPVADPVAESAPPAPQRPPVVAAPQAARIPALSPPGTRPVLSAQEIG